LLILSGQKLLLNRDHSGDQQSYGDDAMHLWQWAQVDIKAMLKLSIVGATGS